MAPIRVLLSGGGTGGHLVPGLNLGHELLARGDVVHLARTGRAVEAPFLPGVPGITVHDVPVMRRGLALPFAVSKSLGPARRLLRRERIDVVVGLGGGGSLPAIVAARLGGIPFVLLEQNVHPGRANRLAARFARRLYTAFPDTVRLLAPRPAVHTGMPLRPGLGRPADGEVRRRLAVEGKTVLLVFGGSQGAQVLNECVPRLAAGLAGDLRRRVAIVHLSGIGKEGRTAAAYSGTGVDVHVLPFHRDMARLYSIADLVLCRAGGTSLVELAAAGRAAVVVPFPWHRDQHQAANARWFVDAGAFVSLDQEILVRGGGGELLATLLRDEARRCAMGRTARRALPLDAGARIADELHRIVEARRTRRVAAERQVE